MPLPPAPDQTRPTIMAGMLGAAPQRAEAAMKLMAKKKKSHLASNRAKSLPSGMTMARPPIMKPTASHGSSSMALNSFTITLGSLR